jgi:hypothetical protein
MDEIICREYYCPACDMPSEEHREGSCRRCGSALVLGKKRDERGWHTGKQDVIVAAQSANL